MTVSIEQLRPHLQAFDFPRLFVEGLGWDHYQAGRLAVQVNEREYSLNPVAEKANFAVFDCAPGEDGAIPSYPVRRKIESQVAKSAFEHLVIFTDGEQTTQIWQWVKREAGKPPACREQQFHAGQSGDPLLLRLNDIAFDLEDEDKGIGISDVTSRVRKAFDVEKVTRGFYDRFRKELTAFGEFIEGITAQGDRDWYASLMLNRMMFVYFVQKQGFLDEDRDYLRNRLKMVQNLPAPSEVPASVRPEPVEGCGRFHQFYRLFLLRLFHEGLGQPEAQRAPDLAALLGKVPFLNGGLFEEHDLERDNPHIKIPDAAFERVFDFFDGYRWHLDERPFREDNEINPDVLGYISRNTVIPFLFDAAKKECPVAFGPDGGVWRLLQEDPDRYIYPAVGHGITWNARDAQNPVRLSPSSSMGEGRGEGDGAFDLPEDIAAGIGDVSKRGGWNAPAPGDYALPTETWREVVARRTRYEEVRAKLASGEVKEINDLITLNLDMERFARDVVAHGGGSDLLRAFWHAMRDVSVLDPTCGSGAFLFAALNILEPLYTACLEGMRGFLDDAERSERKRSSGYLRDFREVLEQVDKHPSERYFILKSIVLNNLYGVDIMEEAVEICKLRLFLKLVAQLESYEQIEPLPDIDFNIRAGNTLVGFSSLDAVRKAMTVMPDGQYRALDEEQQKELARIEEDADVAGRAFDRFREQQTELGGEISPAAKKDLGDRLRKLDDELDRLLAAEYGVNVKKTAAYDAWRTSHQPFHWFVEFYGIMSKGGFDVVIGNPPYIEYSKVKLLYSVRGMVTEGCGNLYAMMMERSLTILSDGRFGMIVPVSGACTDGFAPLRSSLADAGDMVVSHFNDRPSRLFDGIEHCRLSIYLLNVGSSARRVFSTAYNKWQSIERDVLFQRLTFTETTETSSNGLLPKFGHPIEMSILQKFHLKPSTLKATARRSGQESIFYTRKLSSFVQILDFVPVIYDAAGKLRKPSELKEIKFDSRVHRGAVLAFLNSTLFHWLVTLFSDCRNLNKREIEMTRLNLDDKDRIQQMAGIAEELMDDIQTQSKMSTINYRTKGSLIIQSTYPRLSKAIIDEIDRVLAEHYGFTDEELDFIINYDIKYRMGREG